LSGKITVIRVKQTFGVVLMSASRDNIMTIIRQNNGVNVGELAEEM